MAYRQQLSPASYRQHSRTLTVMATARTLIVPNDLQSPVQRQMVIRNVTKYDWVIKVKSDVPQAIRFETDKAVVDSRKYVVLKTALSLKDLPQQQTAPKIYVFARPLFNYNENCVRVWIQRERNELACQLAYVVHLLVNDKVFSAEKLVLDLPGQASAIDAVPFAIEEDLDSRCETALNIDEDTNTANQRIVGGKANVLVKWRTKGRMCEVKGKERSEYPPRYEKIQKGRRIKRVSSIT
ncbi:unnamed protein product [Haemonchus placei]|uniref:Major sperm protein n=1 Tax=Haemonchus placei TaxID=6290 RepID=A0A158QQG6_HAEPC|nr:unnamed protein product [Haemonchus placei]